MDPDLRRKDEESEGEILTTMEARQGETSGHVRIVLAASLALAVVAMLVTYVFFFD